MTTLTAFKAYDVRGRYGRDLTDALARDVAQALVHHLRLTSPQSPPTTELLPLNLVVGYDGRLSGPALHEAVIRGAVAAGARVLDVGLVSTPMLYFGVRHFDADGGIMITASHNPAADNGLKLCRAEAVPIAGGDPDSELEAIKNLVLSGNLPEIPGGSVVDCDVRSLYLDAMRSFADAAPLRKFRVVADFANAVGGIEAEILRERFDLIPLYETLDGAFPNHAANPLDHSTLADLQAAVCAHNADFGLAFDGDADRVGFVDNQGEIVPMDLITGILAAWILRTNKGPVLHDLRSSRATVETIRENGGEPISCRVGHSFMKQEMRDHQAAFGGELAGHFYFRELGNVESTALAVIRVGQRLTADNVTLAACAASLRRYANSGELNLELPDRSLADAALRRLQAAFPHAEATHLDGLLLSTHDWWCNVRPSNTEAKLRIVIEAQNQSTLNSLTSKILTTLQSPK